MCWLQRVIYLTKRLAKTYRLIKPLGVLGYGSSSSWPQSFSVFRLAQGSLKSNFIIYSWYYLEWRLIMKLHHHHHHPKINRTRNIFKKDNRPQIKWKWFYWPFQGSASVLFVSRLLLLYCLDVPYSLVVTGQVRVDLSALLWVMFPCVFCHSQWCPLSEIILNCVDFWSLLPAVQSLN